MKSLKAIIFIPDIITAKFYVIHWGKIIKGISPERLTFILGHLAASYYIYDKGKILIDGEVYNPFLEETPFLCLNTDHAVEVIINIDTPTLEEIAEFYKVSISEIVIIFYIMMIRVFNAIQKGQTVTFGDYNLPLREKRGPNNQYKSG